MHIYRILVGNMHIDPNGVTLSRIGFNQTMFTVSTTDKQLSLTDNRITPQLSVQGKRIKATVYKGVQTANFAVASDEGL